MCSTRSSSSRSKTCGEQILFLTGFGSTETAPFALARTWPHENAANMGLPAAGMELKLVPNGGKLEARVRGPNITPGYWRQDAFTEQAFDDEGFYKLGDAFKFADPADPRQGLLFDGRIAEDFKLSTGTWVSVGPLRARIVDHFAPYVRDVVLAGADRDAIGALVFPDLAACRKLAGLSRRRAGRGRARRAKPARAVCRAARRAGAAKRRLLDTRHAHATDGRAAIDGQRRGDRQGLDQPARGAGEPRRAGRGTLRFAPFGAYHRRHQQRTELMEVKGQTAIVTGGASGLGAACARTLAAAGAKVAVLDVNDKAAADVAIDINGIAVHCDVSDSASAEAAIRQAAADHGPARILVNCAGIGPAKRIVGRDGVMPLADYERVIKINLIGTFNMLRLAGAAMQALSPFADGERGVIVNTASVAAFEGQIGQAAYSSSKGGVAALTLPAAREFSQFGVRVLAIAPGIFGTPMLRALPQEAQDSLGAAVPFPKRLGEPREFAALVMHCIHNTYLNGEVIRIDGALRLAPR